MIKVKDSINEFKSNLTQQKAGLDNRSVLEKTLESPLDCKEIQPVRSKGDQPWDFFGRNDAKAETPALWTNSSTQAKS